MDMRHWAWLRRGYWRYRNLIDWLISLDDKRMILIQFKPHLPYDYNLVIRNELVQYWILLVSTISRNCLHLYLLSTSEPTACELMPWQNVHHSSFRRCAETMCAQCSSFWPRSFWIVVDLLLDSVTKQLTFLVKCWIFDYGWNGRIVVVKNRESLRELFFSFSL